MNGMNYNNSSVLGNNKKFAEIDSSISTLETEVNTIYPADSSITSSSTKVAQTKAVYDAITAHNTSTSAHQDIRTQLASPFNFKGSVSSVANLPSSGNVINDTYYVTDESRLYAWNGSSWDVASMSESEYLSEINHLNKIQTYSNNNFTKDVYSESGWGYIGYTMFSSGGLNESGEPVTNAKNVRSTFLGNKFAYFLAPINGGLRVYYYSNATTSSFIKRTDNLGPFSAGDVVPIPRESDQLFIRIMMNKTDLTNITSQEIAAINRNFAFYGLTEFNQTRTKAHYAMLDTFYKPIPTIYENGLYVFSLGKMVSGSGSIVTDGKWIHMSGVPFRRTTRINCDENYTYRLNYYSNTNTLDSYYIGSNSTYASGNYILDHEKAPDGTLGISIDFHALDWHELTETDLQAIQNSFMFYLADDKMLNQPVVSDSTAVSEFVSFMNKTCSKINMNSTTYTDPSGFVRSNQTTVADNLKLGLAICSTPKALDIWSTHDRDFYIGGENARTISVVNNLVSGESSTAEYKLLGGKGGSLTDSPKIRSRLGVYDVDGVPVIVSCMGSGQWIYDNLVDVTQGVLEMVHQSLSGQTVTPPDIVTTFLTNGGGYFATTVPNCAGVYNNLVDINFLLNRNSSVYSGYSASRIPASTTKTMTLLCALNSGMDLQEVCTVRQTDIVSGSGSTYYPGDMMTLEDALRIMMMESSNTMAKFVARNVGTYLYNVKYNSGAISGE